MKIDSVNQIDSSKAVSGVKNSSQSSNLRIKQKNNQLKKNTEMEVDKDIQQLMTDEMMKKSVKQANKALKQHHRRIDRSVHDVTKTVMYKMVDIDTDEVIREFPPRKIQDMIAKMWELAGLFVDEEV